MAAAVHKHGESNPVITTVTRTIDDRVVHVVTVEGLHSDLKNALPTDFIDANDHPSWAVKNSTLSGDTYGMGKLVINCVEFDDGTDISPVRSTVSVTMTETQYDLIDHPAFTKEVRAEIARWLATDESDRVTTDSSGDLDFYARDKDLALQQINYQGTLKFCRAYLAGIKTFVRYFPVVEMKSVYQNPPGMSRSGRSFASGSPTFSDNIGEYDEPPVTLNGYPSTNWFKSGDSWTQNADTTWSRTQQWTYTPEGSDGEHAWIYNYGSSDE